MRLNFLQKNDSDHQKKFWSHQVVTILVWKYNLLGFNSRSVFGTIRGAMVFNRNLGPLIMYEWKFTKWSINYLDNWRLWVFFRKFLLYYSTYFLQKKFKSSKKPLSEIRKTSKTFFSLHYSPKMTTWPYIQGIRLVKVVLFFSKNT
jgi:hypothetical protein